VGVLTGLEGDEPSIILSSSYVSDTELSDSSTYDHTTLAALGLKPGAYVINWSFDTLTIDVVASPSLPVPEPSSWAMMLIGFTGLGYAALRQKGAVRDVRA
jgi:PEP-CTERM motif